MTILTLAKRRQRYSPEHATVALTQLQAPAIDRADTENSCVAPFEGAGCR